MIFNNKRNFSILKGRRKACPHKVIPLHYSLLTAYCSLFIALTTFSCTIGVKKDGDDDKFERQVSDFSIDEMPIGDDLNYWGSDSPNAVIFILQNKASILKNFGIKIIRFREMDKTFEELNKLVSTEPIYSFELYELPKKPTLTNVDSSVCQFITENFSKAKMIFKASELSFRVKEREWVNINTRINPESLVFVRLGIGEPFSTINNKATDAIWINAKKADKQFESFSSSEKSKINSWTCQETMFIENKSFEPLFYNPDIVFNFE